MTDDDSCDDESDDLPREEDKALRMEMFARYVTEHGSK